MWHSLPVIPGTHSPLPAWSWGFLDWVKPPTLKTTFPIFFVVRYSHMTKFWPTGSKRKWNFWELSLKFSPFLSSYADSLNLNSHLEPWWQKETGFLSIMKCHASPWLLTSGLLSYLNNSYFGVCLTFTSHSLNFLTLASMTLHYPRYLPMFLYPCASKYKLYSWLLQSL